MSIFKPCPKLGHGTLLTHRLENPQNDPSEPQLGTTFGALLSKSVSSSKTDPRLIIDSNWTIPDPKMIKKCQILSKMDNFVKNDQNDQK